MIRWVESKEKLDVGHSNGIKGAYAESGLNVVSFEP